MRDYYPTDFDTCVMYEGVSYCHDNTAGCWLTRTPKGEAVFYEEWGGETALHIDPHAEYDGDMDAVMTIDYDPDGLDGREEWVIFDPYGSVSEAYYSWGDAMRRALEIIDNL